MNTKQSTTIFFAALALVMAGACAGGKEKAAAVDNAADQTAAYADINGQWYIENIVFNDSDYVRPAEAAPGEEQYITFDDSTYFIQTNCNTIAGFYTIVGDSIALGEGMMTRMACPDMATEEALTRIIPRISSIDVQNDSVVRLNGSEPAECIVLRKARQ